MTCYKGSGDKVLPQALPRVRIVVRFPAQRKGLPRGGDLLELCPRMQVYHVDAHCGGPVAYVVVSCRISRNRVCSRQRRAGFRLLSISLSRLIVTVEVPATLVMTTMLTIKIKIYKESPP